MDLGPFAPLVVATWCKSVEFAQRQEGLHLAQRQGSLHQVLFRRQGERSLLLLSDKGFCTSHHISVTLDIIMPVPMSQSEVIRNALDNKCSGALCPTAGRVSGEAFEEG